MPQIAGKTRKPEDVAKDLEKEFTDTAQRLLQKAQFFTAKHSAAKPTHEFCSSGETGLAGFAAHRGSAHVSQAARGQQAAGSATMRGRSASCRLPLRYHSRRHVYHTSQLIAPAAMRQRKPRMLSYPNVHQASIKRLHEKHVSGCVWNANTQS